MRKKIAAQLSVASRRNSIPSHQCDDSRQPKIRHRDALCTYCKKKCGFIHCESEKRGLNTYSPKSEYIQNGRAPYASHLPSKRGRHSVDTVDMNVDFFLQPLSTRRCECNAKQVDDDFEDYADSNDDYDDYDDEAVEELEKDEEAYGFAKKQDGPGKPTLWDMIHDSIEDHLAGWEFLKVAPNPKVNKIDFLAGWSVLDMPTRDGGDFVIY